MRKFLLATMAILWLLTGLGGKLVAQENIAVWKFPATGGATTSINADCVSDLIQSSDCELTVLTEDWSVIATDLNNANTVLCDDGSGTDQTKGLRLVNTNGNYETASIVFRISTAPYRSIQLSYDHRIAAGSLGGYATETWSYSINNGSSYTDMTPIEGGTTSYATESVDFSSISALNGVSSVLFKLTVSAPNASNAATIIDNVVFSGTPMTCLTPVNLAAVADDAPTEAVISWDPAGTNEESYTLVYGTNAINASALNSLVNNGAANVIANVTSPYTLAGLTAGTNYYIYVRANCGGDDNSLWASANVRTPVVCAISGLEATDVAGSTASLSWTGTGSSAMIRVFTAAKDNPWETTDGLFLEETVNGTSYDLTGLAFSTTYHVYAKSVCSANNISETVSTSFTTNFADNIRVLTVNDGTSTNSNVPFYGLWIDDYTRSEMVYPASQLTNMVDGDILNISFYKNSTNTNSWGSASFKVYMKEVSATTLSSYIGMTDATIVYEGSVDASGGERLVTINFTTPYTYAGGNLLIGIYETTAGSYSSAYFYGVTANGASASGYNSTSPASATFNQRNFLPKTTFTYSPGVPPTCPKPTDLASGNVTATSATITWLAGGEETAWMLKWGEADFDVETAGTEVSIETTPSYDVTGLTANTSYDVYVKAVCSDSDESDWKKISFRTTCVAITEFPWTEDFEMYATGDFNDPCWVNEHITGNGSYIFKINSSTQGGNATNKLQLPDMSSGTQTKLVFPMMTLSSDKSYVFALDVYRNNYSTFDSEEGIRIYASTNGEIEGATELAFIPRQYSASSSTVGAEEAVGWYTYQFDIPFTGTCYIVFRGESKYRTATYMDNLLVREASTAAEITAFSFVEDAEVAVINSEAATVTSLVSYSTESLNGLVPTIAVSENATIAPASGVAQDFTGPVTYTVTAEDGTTTKEWTVNVSKVATASTAKDILSFTFSGQSREADIDAENHTVTAYAAWNYDFANNIAPTITVSPQATIYPVSDSSINFATPVTYTVTAEDESTQEWTVTIVNDPNACVNPLAASFEVSDLTSSAATVAWERRYTETSYNVKVSTTAMTDMTATADVYDGVVNDTVIALTGLTENTMYYVYVQSACGIETWVSKSFRTIITPATIPYSHAFEDATENNSWILVNGSQTNKWYIGSVSSNGGNGLYITNDNGTTNAYTVGSVSFAYAYRTITMGTGDYVISFDWKAQGESQYYDYLRAWLAPVSFTFTSGYAPDGGTSVYNYYAANPSGWIPLDEGHSLNQASSWQSKTLTASVSAGTYNLVFMWANDGSGGSQPPASVDNISITQITCPIVSNLEASNMTTTSADITWTERGTATAWDVVFSAEELDETQLAAATPEEVNAASYQATGLTQNTPYYIYVRAHCSAEDQSEWVAMQFRTECGEQQIPYSQNFNEYTATAYSTAGVMPDCWSYIYNGTNTAYAPHVSNSTSYSPMSGDDVNYLCAIASTSATETYGNDNIIMLPPVEGGYANLNVSFAARTSSSTNAAVKLGYMNGDNFVNLTDVAFNTSIISFTYVVPNTVPEGAKLALKFSVLTSASSTVYYGIDNVLVRETSTDNTILSYAASTAQGDAICAVDNDAHTISVELRAGATAPVVIGQTIVLSDANATIQQQVGTEFANVPNYFEWHMTTADTVVVYKVTAENGAEQLYNATITIESCAAPSTLLSEQTSTTNVNCSWTPAEGTSAWNFYCSATQLTTSALGALTASDYTTVATASASATVVGETTYYWYVRTDCSGSYSAWQEGTFTTWENCAAPTNVTTEVVNDNNIVVSWNVQDNLPLAETNISDDFERSTIDGGPFTYTNGTTYPWQIVNYAGTSCIKSSNAGVSSSQSSISMTYTAAADVTLSFKHWVMGEGTTYIYDYLIFTLDGVATNYSGTIDENTGWSTATHNLSAGTHTMTWTYRKDASTDNTGDCAYIDDIIIYGAVPGGNSSVVLYKNDAELVTLPATTTSYTDEGLEAGNYCYKVKTICREGSESDFSAPVCQDINACLAVTNMSATNVTATTATISWTRGDEVAWNMTVNGGSPVALTETDVTVDANVITYALAGLEPMTDYTVTIQSDCGGTVSQSVATVNFTTDRVPATLPYTCGFEDAVENNGWVLLNGTQVNTWHIGTAANNGGANGLYISNDDGVTNAYNTGSASYVFAYRTINVENASDYTISFNWKAYAESCCDYIRAFLVPATVTFTAGSANGIGTTGAPTNWISIDGGNKLNYNSSWQTVSNVISIENAGTYNLVFYWRNDGSGGTMPPAAIDNVSVIEVSCPTVANIVAAPENITNNSAVITWTERGTATNWEIVVSATEVTDFASATAVPVTEASYSATGLNAETLYHVYVRANCGASDNSEWVSSTFSTTASCPEPDGLETSNVSATSATITWNGYFATNWTLEYRIGTTGTWTPVADLTATTYTLTTTGNTTYNVRVKAVCGVDEASDYSEILSFTTPCEALTVDEDNPYIEGFESTTTYEIPSCWERIASYNSGSYEYPYVGSSSSSAHTDSKYLYMYIPSSTAANENIVALPPMNDINTLQISMWARYSTAPQSFEVGYIRNGVFTSVNTIALTSTYSKYTVYMSEAPADAQSIAIRAYHGTSYAYVYIDDINVSVIPSCVEPADIVVSNITNSSASISWTDVNPATAWQYQLNNGEIFDIDAKPIELTGLTANTEYTVNVRTVCGNDEHSGWSTVSFRTSCEAISEFPWSENFETVSTPNLPNCWMYLDANNDGDYWQTYNNNSTEVGLYTDYNSGNNNDYLILPAFELNGSYLFSYDVRVNSSGEPNDYRVVLSTTGFSPEDFNVVLQDLQVVSSTTNQTNEIALNGYNGTVYIAMHVPQGGEDGWYIYFDNFNIREMSSDNTLLSYEATTAQGNAICNLDNESHTISVVLRSGYVAGAAISQTIVPNNENATIEQQSGSNFIALPESFSWFMTTADTTITYKVIAENGAEQLYTANVSVESCPAPLSMAASQTSPTNVNLSWTAAEGTSSWNFYCSTIQLTQSELAVLTDYTTVETASTTYTVAGGTTYYWYVRTACDGSNSAWMSDSFTSWEECLVPTNLTTSLVNDNDIVITWNVQDDLPVEESTINDGFERDAINGGDLTYTNSTGALAWSIVSSGAHTGSKCLKSASGNNSSTSQISMSVDLSAPSPFSFWYKVSSESSYDEFSFAIDGSDVVSGESGEVSWSQYSTTLEAGPHNLVWKYTKDVSVASGSDCAWIDDISINTTVVGANSSVVLYKDDVELVTLPATTTSYTDAGLESGTYCYKVKTVCREDNESAFSESVCQEINSCLAVTGVAASEITSSSALISWTRGADETAWNVIVNGGTPIAVNETTEGVIVDGDEISYALANLEPNTAYTVAIQSNCDGTLGQGLPNVEFNSLRVPTSLPFVCDFEDATENSEWVLENGTQTNKWHIGTAASNGGANGLYISSNNGASNSYNTDSETYSYAYRPIEVEEAGHYDISFDWKSNGEEYYDFLRAFAVPVSASQNLVAGEDNGIEAYYSTGYVPTGWIDIANPAGELSAETTWQHSEKAVALETGIYNVVFFWENDYSDGDQTPAAIDNVSIERSTFTINASVGGEGYGTIDPSGEFTVADGATQTFTMTPWDGFALSSFMVNGVESLSQVVNNTYTIESVGVDYTIVATFAPELTITATAGNGGSITPAGVISVGAGANLTFTATADEGYVVSSVLVDNEEQITDDVVRTTFNYTFENVAEDHTIAASFVTMPSLTITATASAGGTISPSGQVTVPYNGSQTFEFTPDEGYSLANIVVDNGPATAENNSYTFRNVIADHTINANFAVNSYNLTIHYVYADNTTAAPDHTETVAFGTEYSVASPAIAGYTADTETVAGTMPAQDVEVTVTYNANSYTLTIHYVYADNTTAAPDHTETVAFGATYSVESPVLDGYTADQLTVAGTMPAEDVTVTVTYTANAPETYTLTIHYVYADNTTAAADHVETLAAGATYSVASPVIDGYTADQLTVAGTMPAEDVTVTVTYTANAPETYTLTIHYVYAANNATAAPDHTETLAAGANYSVASPVIDGYTASQATVAGTMPAQNVEVTVTYTANAPETYTLTIHYVFADDNTTAAPDHTETLAAGANYSVASPVIDGYTASQATVAGTMPAQNVEVTVTYTANSSTTYTIIATCGNNGTISPSGVVYVPEGANKTFTITPAAGYRIATVMVDNVSVIDDVVDYQYTFYNVTADHNINVTFTNGDAVDEYTAGSMSVYPNPNNGMFSIEFANINGDATYQLIDARGAVVETRDINVMNGDTMNFNYDLRPGAYFVRIITADKVYVEQIVVE